MALPALFTWLYFVALQGHPSGVQQTVYAVGKVLLFSLPVLGVLLLRMPACPWFRRSMSGVASSLLFGGLVFALIVGGYFFWPSLSTAGAEIHNRLVRFGISSVWQFAIMGVFYSAIHSFLEEYYWRWFVFGQLRQWCSPTWAAVLSSLAFMPHHVIVLGLYFGHGSANSILFSLGVSVGGGVWCWIYHRSNSLLGPWLSHALADAAIFTVGYQLLRPAMGW